MNSLLAYQQAARVMNAVAAGTTEQTSSSVRCNDCLGVLFTVLFGTITSGAATSIKMQESADDSSWADIAGSAQTVADSSSNKAFQAEIVKPLKEYVRLVVVRGTQNAVIDGVLAQKFELFKKPSALHSTVAGSESHVSPAAGTA